MRRGIHIAVSFMAVVLLLKPFECFSSGPLTQKSADCCNKGKCAPSTNSDDCCKGTLPGGQQLVTQKAPHQYTPALDLITANVAGPLAPVFTRMAPGEAHAPPGSPPNSRLVLPLLI